MRCFAPAALKHILLKNNLDIWPQIQGKQTDVLHVEEKNTFTNTLCRYLLSPSLPEA